MDIALKIISVISGSIGALFLLIAFTTEWSNNAKRCSISIDKKMWLICGSCAVFGITVSYFSWFYGV